MNFPEAMFYENYLTSDFHTNTVISSPFAPLSRQIGVENCDNAYSSHVFSSQLTSLSMYIKYSFLQTPKRKCFRVVSRLMLFNCLRECLDTDQQAVALLFHCKHRIPYSGFFLFFKTFTFPSELAKKLYNSTN